MSTTVEGQSINLSGLFAEIVIITQELFPGEVSSYVLEDPEYPQCLMTVIEAQASGPVEGVVERRAEWHRRITRFDESCKSLCLTLNYQE